MATIKLSEWATQNGVDYLKSHRMFTRGKVPGAFKDGKHILVSVPDKLPQPVDNKVVASMPDISYENISLASTTETRKNRSATSDIVDRFANIDSGLVPVQENDSSNISVKDAISLSRKAYFNFDIIRNIIDIMTEFSVGQIFFKGGNKASRKFFESYLKSINIYSFQDKYYREYYRSGNVFIFPFNKKVDTADIKRIKQAYDLEATAAKDVILPAKFVILNPTDIEIQGSVDFSSPVYLKVLNSYEISRLRNPQTEQDKEVLKSLPKEVRDQIVGNKNRRTGNLNIQLPPDQVVAVFYKKQDYEALAVPMVFPVLDNINWKSEMRKMDMAVTKLLNQAILLITMGAKPEEGGINNKNIQAMQQLFTNESVGRVLVADYTTKAEFIIPEISNILDPKKYESVNQDIFNGLNYILVGDEKFANQSIKVQLFVERLKHGREVFINDFLFPLIKKIAEQLNFKSYPEPYFQEINLKNEVEWARIYTRLAEIGFLTPEETFEAMETGKMPLLDESEESQNKLKGLRDKGLYEPVMGGPFTQNKLADKKVEQQSKLGGINGRPPGTKRPKSTTKVSPMTAKISFAAIKDKMFLSQKLQENVVSKLKEIFNLAELSKEQLIIAEELTEKIIFNEASDKWLDSVSEYVQNPTKTNSERLEKIESLAYEYQVDNYLASLILEGKIE